MTNKNNPLTTAADKLDALLGGSTDGPWWFDEDDDCFRLHGVAFRIPPQGPLPEQIVNSQILKAPKRGTSYAEYWPNTSDAGLIVAMANPIVGKATVALLRHHAGQTEVPAEVVALAEAIIGPPPVEDDPELVAMMAEARRRIERNGLDR